jgi:hypothetical protein
VKLIIMCAGIGSPGTLAAVFGGAVQVGIQFTRKRPVSTL